MNKLYNTQLHLTSGFTKFFLKAIPDIRKSHLNILPFIIFGMIISESCVPSDIAKVLKDYFSSIQFDSVSKRIRRFFSNKLFNPYLFYHKFKIMSIIKNKHFAYQIYLKQTRQI